MILIVVEVFAVVTTLILAILWIKDPSGNYEPWTVICGIIVAGIEFLRRRKGSATPVPPLESREAYLISWIQKNSTEKPLSELLSQALQLAQILGDRNLEHWIRLELYGYTEEGGMVQGDQVPDYRNVLGFHEDQYGRKLTTDTKTAFINTYSLRYGAKQLEEIEEQGKDVFLQDSVTKEMLYRHFQVEIKHFCFTYIEVSGVINRIQNHLLEKINKI